MTDDREELAGGGPQDPGAGLPGHDKPSEPDQTQPFTPHPGPRPGSDETQVFDPGADPDRTRAIGSQTGPDQDRTQAIPDPDQTRAIGPRADPDQDRTRAFGPRADPDPTRQQPGPAPWSGRAGVPPPRPAAGTAEPTGWGRGYGEPHGYGVQGGYGEDVGYGEHGGYGGYGDPGGYGAPGGRPWWTPIVVGLVALLFLGVLGFAYWLLTESADRDAPVAPSPSATTAESSPTRTPTPTATTARPTPSPTSPASFPVPPLVGLSLAEAQDLLDELGLESSLEFRISNRPAGTVIDTEPGAGVLVSPGDTVTLVVVQPQPSLPDSPVPTTTQPDPTGWPR